MKKVLRYAAFLLPGALLGAPLLAFAQTGINPTYLQGYSKSIVGVINSLLVPVLIAIAFIVFLYGVYKYFILGAGDEAERATGRQFTLWGIIGFVVILSVWALVYVVMTTFGLSIMAAPPTPKL